MRIPSTHCFTNLNVQHALYRCLTGKYVSMQLIAHMIIACDSDPILVESLGLEASTYLVLVLNTTIVVALLDHKVDRWSIMKIFLHAVEIRHQVGILERERGE